MKTACYKYAAGWGLAPLFSFGWLELINLLTSKYPNALEAPFFAPEEDFDYFSQNPTR